MSACWRACMWCLLCSCVSPQCSVCWMVRGLGGRSWRGHYGWGNRRLRSRVKGPKNQMGVHGRTLPDVGLRTTLAVITCYMPGELS